ncbi:MAG TPA: GIY-YIG nuclease family protein [Cyclobacteriaceae bacterium]
MFCLHILYSRKLDKYYVGSTQDFEAQLYRHNSVQGKLTRKWIPRKWVTTIEFKTRPEAVRLEKIIKKRGIRRYLEENGLK